MFGPLSTIEWVLLKGEEDPLREGPVIHVPVACRSSIKLLLSSFKLSAPLALGFPIHTAIVLDGVCQGALTDGTIFQEHIQHPGVFDGVAVPANQRHSPEPRYRWVYALQIEPLFMSLEFSAFFDLLPAQGAHLPIAL
jgi:hypothetical protein